MAPTVQSSLFIQRRHIAIARRNLPVHVGVNGWIDEARGENEVNEDEDDAEREAILNQPQIEESRNAAPVSSQKRDGRQDSGKHGRQENDPGSEYRMCEPHKEAVEQGQLGARVEHARDRGFNGFGDFRSRRKSQVVGRRQRIIFLIAAAQQVEQCGQENYLRKKGDYYGRGKGKFVNRAHSIQKECYHCLSAAQEHREERPDNRVDDVQVLFDDEPNGIEHLEEHSDVRFHPTD